MNRVIKFRAWDKTSVTTDVIRESSGQWQARSRDENDITHEHGLPLTWGGWNSILVIGNIYENPELMK